MRKWKQTLVVFLFGFLCSFSYVNSSRGNVVSSCTNFKIRSDQTVFFGNNEDKAYGQISNVFITFIPSGYVWYQNLQLKYGAVIVGYANDSGLSWFQGGMNERGLAFDSTSVPFTEPNPHDERLPFLVPEIFSCENISEVIEYRNSHNVYHEEGSVQSFYVDKTGESVVFHIGEDGNMDFFRNNESFQLASNYYVENPSRGNPAPDAIRRYDTAEQMLNNMVDTNNISIESITSVLDAVHFEGPLANTIYSNIFDVTNEEIHLFYFHQFAEVVKLNLTEELAKGRHSYRISDLFTQELVDSAFDEYYEYPYLIRIIPTDLLLLIFTAIFDSFLVLALLFVLIKKLFIKIRRTTSDARKQPLENEVTYRGFRSQILISLAVIWSFLSFPMIYWNHKGEWWPLTDDIPMLQWPLQPFYAFQNLFLLLGLVGIISIAFLLFSFTDKKEPILLMKRGLSLGKRKRWRIAIILGFPILIGLFTFILEISGIISKVDWVMYAIMYPLIVVMLLLLAPYAEKRTIEKQDFPQRRLWTDLLKSSIILISTWGLWFLPLLLTRILDYMYVILLVNLSLSIMFLAFFEVSQGKNLTAITGSN